RSAHTALPIATASCSIFTRIERGRMIACVRSLRFVSAVVACLTPLPAAAQSADQFFAGKQIRLLLSAGAGGGYASYAIAFAPYLSKHIPGNPTIIVDYMTGAGGIRAMNFLYANAPKDGTVLGLVHSSV